MSTYTVRKIQFRENLAYKTKKDWLSIKSIQNIVKFGGVLAGFNILIQFFYLYKDSFLSQILTVNIRNSTSTYN